MVVALVIPATIAIKVAKMDLQPGDAEEDAVDDPAAVLAPELVIRPVIKILIVPVVLQAPHRV